MTGNALYGQTMPGRNSLASPEAEHPVIAAARNAGADVDAMLGGKDLNGLLDAAVRGDPRLATDSGSMMLHGFAEAFKRTFGITARELPGARPPGNMPNALFGPSGLPRPLQRPQGYD